MMFRESSLPRFALGLVLVLIAACAEDQAYQSPLAPTLAGDITPLATTDECKVGGSVRLTPGGPGTDGTWYTGTAGNDVIRGTAGPDKIDGAGGSDTICSYAGADSVKGGAGNDILYPADGDDWADGEGDDDLIVDKKGNDVLNGGTGDDTIDATSGNDVVRGGADDDAIKGGAGNDDLFGEAGDDVIQGQQNVDDLDGGTGADNCQPGGQGGDTRVNCELFLAQVTAGNEHSCGVEANGKAWCWGADGSGQLGDGTAGGTSATPVAVTGGHLFASLSAGYYYTCGVRTDGAAYCWGDDGFGVLGDGTTGGSTATPGAVVGGHTFANVSAGLDHTCGVRTDGAGYCWGKDDFGPLGDGTTGSPAASPTPVAVTGGHTFEGISAHRSVSCGDRTDGAGYCWGYDGYGVVGDGTVDSPQDNPTPVAVTGGHTFDQLVVGSDGNSTNHACGLRTDGAAYCWGNDDFGQLGDGTAGPSADPTPGAVTGAHVFDNLTANQYITCGVRTDGAAYCWGDNSWGQLGIGFYSGSINATPIAVTGGHTFDHLAAGFLHTCGVRTDGAAFCWGRDASGQLGDGSGGDGGTTTPQPVIAP